MKTDSLKETFKYQQKVSFISLLLELPNMFAQIVLVVITGSLIVALDAVDSVSNTIQSMISYVSTKKMQKDDSFKYDYGMGKIDAFSSFISNTLLYIGLAVVLISSFITLIKPKIPEKLLLIAFFFKIINVSVDLWLLIKQSKIDKQNNSSIIESTTMLLKKNLYFDSIVLVSIAISYFFRDYHIICYFEPLMCIIIALYIMYRNKKLLRGNISDLLDETLDEKTQLIIIKCFSKIYPLTNGFQGIRTRRSGSLIYIDLMVSFDDKKTYAEIFESYELFNNEIKSNIPNCISAIVIAEEKQD